MKSSEFIRKDIINPFDLAILEEQFGTIYPRTTKVNGKVTYDQLLNRKLLEYIIKNHPSRSWEIYEAIKSQKACQDAGVTYIIEAIQRDDKIDSLYRLFNEFATDDDISVGDKICVISVTAEHLGGNTMKVVDIDGFTSPQKVVAVDSYHIWVADGSSWPPSSQVIHQAIHDKQTIIFKDSNQANKCLMVLLLLGNKTGEWVINNNVNRAEDEFAKYGLSEELVTEKSVSAKQARFMAAAAHDPKFAKKVGIKQSVAKEFNQADKGTKLLKKANESEVTEAGKKGMSAHAKEVAAKKKEYDLEQDRAAAKREREEGTKFNFGNAEVTKKGAK